VIGALEGDSFPWAVDESSITIGTLEEGWGFPVLILVLFLALKYIEVCLFLFSFGFNWGAEGSESSCYLYF